MKFNIYLFFGQCLILFNQHKHKSAKAMIGHNIRQASSGQYAFIVSIMTITPGHPHSGGNHFCTGVLTTRKDVLTAAHCLEEELLNAIQIVIGTIDIRNGTVYYPFWWQTYDQWAVANNITIDFDMNDIANLRIILLVPPSLYPARLSSLSNPELYGAEVSTAGWGINNDGIVPEIMQVANLKVLTNTECERRIERFTGERLHIDERLMCGVANPYTLMEIGDSGGPFLFRNRLIGINKGTCPEVNGTHHRRQVNIHLGTHKYKRFINYMKNLF